MFIYTFYEKSFKSLEILRVKFVENYVSIISTTLVVNSKSRTSTLLQRATGSHSIIHKVV